MSRDDAFLNSRRIDHGADHKTISKQGILAVYEARRHQQGTFEGVRGHVSAAREILEEIYDQVSSGNEIRGVVLAGTS